MSMASLHKKFESIPGYFQDWLYKQSQRVNPVNPRRPTGRGRGTGNSDKTHCPFGHAYDKENTRIVTFRGGKQTRQCRACDNRRSKEKWAKWKNR